MIDKRVKTAAPSRKRDDQRKGKARPERATAETPEKPRRFARPAQAKSAKPDLHRKPKPRKQDARPPRDESAGMRIAKVMARAGLCSRRDAETWIEEGRVSLNGKVLTTPAINVGPQDMVSVDGVALAPRERTRLFLFHKPRGLVTTDKDPEGRQTIFDYLHQNWPDGPRVISIGRLDINTEGLLLLTNDGGLARVLELPSTGWVRRYRVRANGKTAQSILDRLREPLTVDGVDYAGIDATLDRVQGDNVWLSLGLREGKNREIKRVLEHIGLYVNRLIRVSFGPFQLGELAEGKVEEVRTRVLRDQLGPALANEADADFDSPVAEPHKEETPPTRGRVRPHEAGRDKPARGRDAREAPSPRGRDHKPSPLRSDRRGPPAEKREAPAPVEPSFKPRGPRKHISAMRATVATPEKGERKRTSRSETADRKGRTVAVELVTKAVPRKRREEPAQDREEARRERPSGRATRPARFKADDAARPAGKARHGGKPSTRQEASPRPSGGKGATRKPAAEGAKPASARPQGSYPKGTYPKGARPAASDAAKGAGRTGAPAKGGRPMKPGRPQRPR